MHNRSLLRVLVEVRLGFAYRSFPAPEGPDLVRPASGSASAALGQELVRDQRVWASVRVRALLDRDRGRWVARALCRGGCSQLTNDRAGATYELRPPWRASRTVPKSRLEAAVFSDSATAAWH